MLLVSFVSIVNLYVLAYPSRPQPPPAYLLLSPSIRGCCHFAINFHLADIMATSKKRSRFDDDLLSPPDTKQTTNPLSFRPQHVNPAMVTPPRQSGYRRKSVIQSPSMPTSEELRNFRTLPEQFLSELKDLENRLSQPRHMHSTNQKHGSSSLPRHPIGSPSPPILTPNTPVLTHSQPTMNPQSLQPTNGPSPSPQYHQVKTLPMFTGREGSAVCIDDWIRDTKYLISSTSMPAYMQFPTIVRYLGGAARKLVLNLPPEQQTPSDAFSELHAQYGEISLFGDPLADFYERVRQANESPTIYAVELEATLRTVEERMNRGRPLPTRNRMLTQQFMRGVRDDRVTQRLAPMRPREMTYRELQQEIRQFERETKTASLSKSEQAQSQFVRSKPQTQPTQQKSYGPTPTEAPPSTLTSSQVKTNTDVLPDLVLAVRQLAEKVEKMTTKPITTSSSKNNLPD